MSFFDTLPKRIQKKIMPEPNNGCWIWTGYCDPRGYARLYWVIGQEKKAIVVTRLFMEMILGRKFGRNEYICHTCDIRSCVNPDHLFVGSPRVNNLDCVLKGRRNTKMNYEKVVELRQLYAGGTSHKDLSKKYGITQSHVFSLLNDRHWNKAERDAAMKGGLL